MFFISRTAEGTKTYPLHRHNNYEIMMYLWGNGVMRTEEKDYPFSPGTIIIIPPGILHGSSSQDGFENISVSGDFGSRLQFEKPVVFRDNSQQEGKNLALQIYNNRSGNEEYLDALCSAFVLSFLQNVNIENALISAVEEIIKEITDNYRNSEIDLCSILKKSGYAEDYIRAQFKKITKCTPNEFLTELRIKEACFLIDIYGQTLSLQQIAEQCGYTDYVYFSKKFKSFVGFSPLMYKKNL